MARKYDSPARREQAQATRQRVVDALVALLVEDHTRNTSIPMVAERAGVAVRTVYQHFATKEALFDALPDAVAQSTGAPEPPAPGEIRTPDALAVWVARTYEFFDANIEILEAIHAHDDLEQHTLEARTRRRMADLDSHVRPLVPRLDDRSLRQLQALIALLGSYDAYQRLSGRYGLTADEAGEAAAWAIETVLNRARRGHVSRMDGRP